MRAAIILAAGASRRFGAANKLLVRHRGRPLLHHALKAALEAPVGRVLVVTGYDQRRVEAVVRNFGSGRIGLIHALNHREGRRASLRTGLSALPNGVDEAFVLLGDLPLVPRGIFARLLRAASPGTSAVRPFYQDVPGHPVLIRDIAAAVARLDARQPPFAAGEVARIAAGRGVVYDIDRPSDLRDARMTS